MLQNDAKPGRPSEGVIIELVNATDVEMERNDEMTSPELVQRIFKEFRIQFSRAKKSNVFGKNLAGYRLVPSTATEFGSQKI